MASKRGVVYMVWGTKVESYLERSIASVKAIHPELPIEVIRTVNDNAVYGLQQKSSMLARTPFEETLFLDADTVVLDKLDYGFDKAVQFGLACCICECPWAARYSALAAQRDLIEYNTGVLFFTKKAQPVFDRWAQLAGSMDASLVFIQDGKPAKMVYNDQASFAVAVDETGFSPFVLPLNWNFRPEFVESFFGPIKIYHAYADVPKGLGDLATRYRNREMIIQRHAVTIRPQRG
jgi:hypothetical protein